MNLAEIKRGKGLTERAACKHLAILAGQVRSDQAIVELGAYCGRTTAWLAWGSARGHRARVVAIDTWDMRSDVPAYAVPGIEPNYSRGDYSAAFGTYQTHLARCGVDSMVDTIKGYGHEVGDEWEGPPVGLLWHDAEHSADAIESDLNAWLPHLTDDAVVAFHDACQEGMEVIEGAGRVLDTSDWDWPGEIRPWAKHPNRRGMLVVRRR